MSAYSVECDSATDVLENIERGGKGCMLRGSEESHGFARRISATACLATRMWFTCSSKRLKPGDGSVANKTSKAMRMPAQ